MNEIRNPDTPTISAQEMQRWMAGELSLRSRLAYTALLLVALASSGAIAALWLTEPSLPMRTQIAFGLMIPIGLSWVAYAGWVLTRRRVLLAGHRIVAARMAVAFSALFAAGSAVLGVWGPAGPAAFAAAGFGLFMLAVAAGLLLHARRQFARLLERRRALQLELGRS
ncbi:MAG TPA: transmembrane transport protein [Thermoanaerobaculia bacterium]|nr:transmembrane transport protein [Thermoanaerobaculia bacterium]